MDRPTDEPTQESESETATTKPETLCQAHPNILNLLVWPEREQMASLGSKALPNLASNSTSETTSLGNATATAFPTDAPKSQPAASLPQLDPHYSFLSAYQRPVPPFTPPFKRPCSEETLARLKNKFCKATQPAYSSPPKIPTEPTPPPLYQSCSASSILKDALLGHRPPAPEIVSKPATSVAPPEDDEIRLVSTCSRVPLETGKENSQKASNQNRTSVICRLSSRSVISSGTSSDESSREAPKMSSLSEVSGKTFIDAIFKSIMNSVPEINEPDPPEPKVTEPVKSPTTPKPVILEPKPSLSCASALSALLQTDPCPFTALPVQKPSTSSTQRQNPHNLGTNRVYQQMIEFEFNHEAIVRKFKNNSTCFGASFTSRLELNALERSKIDELGSALGRLHLRCLFEEPSSSATATTGNPATKTEALVTLFVTLSEQLEVFSQLTTFDRMSLLSGNLVELLLLRSLLVRPNCVAEQYAEKERPEGEDDLSDDDDQLVVVEDEEEPETAVQFRLLYNHLARSIDKNWCKDERIFNLVFAILLFRVDKHQSIIVDREKIREEHLSYVYLLKRVLEHRFRSFCTARSHFIRIFDHLEELHGARKELVAMAGTAERSLLELDCFC